MEMLFYFGKSLLVTAAFYVLYRLVLKKLTFFALNRSFLLLALAAAAVVPALHFTTQANVPLVFHQLPLSDEVITIPAKVIQQTGKPTPTVSASPINYMKMLYAGYWLITALLMCRLLISVGKVMIAAYRQGHKRGGLCIINNMRGFNFSFFNLVFLDGTGLTHTERRQVFIHEALHCRLGHSADNLLCSIIKVFFWFNPLVYLLSRELRLTHEFQVDAALTDGRRFEADGYVNLLLKIATKPSGSLVNTFGSGSLKGRVKMLMQSRSAKGKRLVYPAMLVLLLPLCLGLTGQKALPLMAQSTLQNKPALEDVLTAIAPEIKSASLVKPTERHNASPVKTKYVSTHFKLTVTGEPLRDTTKIKMLAADTLIDDSTTKTFHLRGNAVAQIGNTMIKANYIRINLKDKMLFASKVRVEDSERPNDKMVVIGDSLRYDLKTDRAISYNASQH